MENKIYILSLLFFLSFVSPIVVHIFGQQIEPKPNFPEKSKNTHDVN
jgi:hypothetical protein